MSDSVRTAIVAQLQTVTGIGRVHAYQRYAANNKALADCYVQDGQLRGWFVRRLSVQEKTGTRNRNVEISRWLLRGYLAVSDEQQSELEFDGVIDGIRAAFRAEQPLAGAAVWTRATDANGQAGIALTESAPVLFAGVLCHAASCSLFTRRILLNDSLIY